MKKLLISMVCVTAVSLCHAQNYRTSVGVRGDWSNLDVAYSDLTVKHFFNETPNAIEAHLGFGRRHLWLQGMYVRNYRFFGDFEWFWGLGGDVGYWNQNYAADKKDREYAGVWAGFDANVGLEYTFESFPINLSLDLGPTLRVRPYVELAPMVGLSIRYAFR